MEKVALVDLDIFTYRIGFTTEDVDLNIAKARLDAAVIDVALRQAKCTSLQGYLTTQGAIFRHAIAVTAPYKGGRGAPKPRHYHGLRTHMMVGPLNGNLQEDQEADDALGIEATRLGPDKCVVCSTDKDLLTIPGVHYNFVTKEWNFVSEVEARVNHYRQILTGDKVDNIIGIYGLGPVWAKKLITPDMSEEAMYTICVEMFDDNEARVIENAQLTYIRRQPNEIWRPFYDR